MAIARKLFNLLAALGSENAQLREDVVGGLEAYAFGIDAHEDVRHKTLVSRALKVDNIKLVFE